MAGTSDVIPATVCTLSSTPSISTDTTMDAAMPAGSSASTSSATTSKPKRGAKRTKCSTQPVRNTRAKLSGAKSNSLSDLLMDDASAGRAWVSVDDDRDDDDDNLLAQSDYKLCGHCKDVVALNDFDPLILECCFCKIPYHSCCLKIDESLEPYLYVIASVGGWCCHACRELFMNKSKISKKQNDRAVIENVGAFSTIPTILTNMNLELSALKVQIQSLSDNLPSNTQASQVGDFILKRTYAQVTGPTASQADPAVPPLVSVDQSSSSSSSGSAAAGKTSGIGKELLASNLNDQFRTAVLSAVHSEFKSISNRSSNIVISGLASRSGKSDKERFIEFCQRFFNFSPSVHSSRRLGSINKGKIQPLLISLNNSDDADYLLINAKNLRSVADPYVKGNIYINKHFTSAEAKANFEARSLRRNKSSNKPQAANVASGTVANGNRVAGNVSAANTTDAQQASA